MHLTDHTRKQLLDRVIAAQKDENPLLKGLDLHRLQRTLERDLSNDELFSIMMIIGGHQTGGMVRLSAKAETAPSPTETPAPLIETQDETPRWKVERPSRIAMFRSLTHRNGLGTGPTSLPKTA